MRVLMAQINSTIGDLNGNTEKILLAIAKGKQLSADVVLFPELCLTGYLPDDLLLLPQFIDSVEQHLEIIRKACVGISAVIGTIRRSRAATEKFLYNSAALISDTKLVGFQDKILLPTYDVFDERRYFEPGERSKIWNIAGKKVGITICEDIWQHGSCVKFTRYLKDPIADLKRQHPDFILNLSASPFSIHKLNKRRIACTAVALSLGCPMFYCNQVGANDEIVYDGNSTYIDGEGQILVAGKAFEEDFILVDLSEKPSPISTVGDTTLDLYKALSLGIKDYFHKLGLSKACLGLSGGIDSAVTACIAVEALGKENVLGVLMPSRYTSKESVVDAENLAKNLGIKTRTISIEKPFQSYLDVLSPEFEGMPVDITEENIQARIRGMILMSLSNKFGYIVLGTGNKSEMAMGYATLYGDLCGGLGVISDVTKRQVYALAHLINREREVIPWNTIQKPPSAELRPNQKDSDSLPLYDIIDNVLEDYVENHVPPDEIAKKFGYPLDLIHDLIKRIHANEYKRRQSPPGLRVTEKAFTVGRKFPIVQRWVK